MAQSGLSFVTRRAAAGINQFGRRIAFCLFLLLAGEAEGQQVSFGIQAPEGFEIDAYADDELAHDIYSLAIDSLGRVTVAGRGYVRILIDEDGDGVADIARQFSDNPQNGAMGLFWQGRDLICTGDAGLLRLRDRDGDDLADGSPELLLELKTGGEHDVHAVRQGPDGWWYVLGGNGARLDARYVLLPESPVKKPTAGALLRLSPDFTRSEIIADGFRNPYDFDFNSQGSIFTYDSDGERDISLPWYRPTRVFRILPGASAGWISRSWKRPGHFFDMPPVVAAFGRGSPTGVACYRHTRFPELYHDGLFVLDWTYGRVLFVPAGKCEGENSREPRDFLTGVGTYGFAPTDIAVGQDGSLFISVGGRGTRGGVFRVRWTGGNSPSPPADDLDRCLNPRQPLSAWSRATWEPLADELGAGPFLEAAADESRPVLQRLRAIEILTERFGSTAAVDFANLTDSQDSRVRARAAWAIGRTGANVPDLLGRLLQDPDDRVVRAALEAVLGKASAGEPLSADLIQGLAKSASTPDRFVRQLTGRVLARTDEATRETVNQSVEETDGNGQLTLAFAEAIRNGGDAEDSLAAAVPFLLAGHRETRLEAARICQLALGDVGPGSHDPVFDGFVPQKELEMATVPFKRLAETLTDCFPSGDDELDREFSRLLAMIQVSDEPSLQSVLAKITGASHPVDDLHYLIVSARLPVPRTGAISRKIADSLLALDEKFSSQGLVRDSNWDDRIEELYSALSAQDPDLTAVLIEDSRFGTPGHVYFVRSAPKELRRRAVEAFVAAITSEPDYQWTGDLVRFLGSHSRPAIRDLLRSQIENSGLRPAILVALAESPQPRDRELFVDGLQSADLQVLRSCITALRQLGPSVDSREQVELVRTLRRVGSVASEKAIQQSISLQLAANLDVQPPAPHTDVVSTWTRIVQQRFPAEWAAQSGTNASELQDLAEKLNEADWSEGDPARGAELFHKRSCNQCHGGRRALGPDLQGAAARFGPEDLFVAIAFPHKDVSPRYQTTLIVTDSGHAHTGIVIYESIDGLLLRNSQGETIRIESDQIDVRQRLSRSLMPAGLLKDLAPSDLSDLYAYLRTLAR